ncbi:hypothetical protein IAD21_00213 [Abditibacteriota bacterium]|nr:hypothetical protein IAD21_00213 [Abditibacteriota bacterium]
MRAAFTLIEVLVVVAIIAILAAILFPVFARARENARRSTCQSNLRQIALGIAQYVQDYDEKFPLGVVNRTLLPTTGTYAWGDAVQTYIKSLQVYQCPSEPIPADPDPRVGFNNTISGYMDYGYNASFWARRGTFNAAGDCYDGQPLLRPTVSLADLEHPSLTVLVADGSSTASYNGTGDSIAPGFVLLVSGGYAYPRRHLNGSNFAFTDGHVKWYRDQDRVAYSTAVYSVCNTFATSGESPTYHFKDFE